MTSPAVSYTHLDVYKRQVKNSRADYVAELLNGLFNLGGSTGGGRGGELAPGLKPAQLSGGGLSGGSGLGGSGSSSMGGLSSGGSSSPVSYTHLDVYKRQQRNPTQQNRLDAKPQTAGPGLRSRPSGFESIEDLQQVPGMIPVIYDRLTDLATVFSEHRGVNPELAPVPVLRALGLDDRACLLYTSRCV